MKFYTTLIVISLALWLPSASGGNFQSDLKEAMPIFRADEQRLAAIEKFAITAKSKDSNVMLDLFAPAARQAEGDGEMLKFFNQEVIPVFTSYEKLHTYRYIEPRKMPDGNVGYRYYTYFISEAKEEIPFDIIVMDLNGKTFIANFNSRGCIKGKHPICK